MQTASHAGFFLVSTVFDLYVWVVLLRLILSYQRTDYFNPLSQFVLKLTNFVVTPLKKIAPDMNGIEMATVLWLVIVMLVKLMLIALLAGVMPNPLALLIWLLASLISAVLNLYFYLIIVTAIASWVAQGQAHPVLAVLNKIVDPLLAPIRRFVPVIAGFDLSPLVAIIAIKLIQILLTSPLYRLIGM